MRLRRSLIVAIAGSTAAVVVATLRQNVVTEGTATIAGMGNTEATAIHAPTGVNGAIGTLGPIATIDTTIRPATIAGTAELTS